MAHGFTEFRRPLCHDKTVIYERVWWYIKLKLQYFGHLMQTVDSLEKTLMLGGTGGRRRRG